MRREGKREREKDFNPGWDLPSHTKHEKQLLDLHEEDASSRRGPRSPVLCTEKFLMAKGQQGQMQHEDTQARHSFED